MRRKAAIIVCIPPFVLAALAIAGAAAASGPWAWTKSQAEYYTGGNVGLATACTPLGQAYRQDGRNYYYEFRCVEVFPRSAGGGTFIVTIKPTGPKKYVPLAISRPGASSGAGGLGVGPYFDTGSGHWIQENDIRRPRHKTCRQRPRLLDVDGQPQHDRRDMADLRRVRLDWHRQNVVPRGVAHLCEEH
jgi:hypothetical protein